jgi:LPXTG-motif cell wall-anchored protein
MKRSLVLGALSAVILSSFAPPVSGAEVRTKYALEGEARALEISVGDQGVTLGLAMSRADSTPRATGVGAGQCAVLGDNPDPDDLPCNEDTTEKSSTEGSVAGKPGEAKQRCAGPQIPAPLNTVLKLDLACGSSISSLLSSELPTTFNKGKVGELSLGLDLAGLIPQAEDAKEQLVDALQEVINQAPEQVRDALNQILDALDDGEAGRLVIGPATSNVDVDGPELRVNSSAAGALIGVVGIPDLDKEGQPILGTSDATEDGLLIIEVGRADANATVRKTDAHSNAEASAAIVTVKVRDITQAKPTYQEISVAPGQEVTVLEGTPAESTISAATATKKESEGSAVAAADAVRLHLLKGVEGGVKIGLGRTTAAVSGAVSRPAPPERAPRVLPQTGARNLTLIALGLLLLAAILFVVRRRLTP